MPFGTTRIKIVKLMKTFRYESMGTFWEITIWDDVKTALFNKLGEEIIDSSNKFDNAFSRFKHDSLVQKIAKQSGKIKVPRDFVRMLSYYLALYELSERKLNPLVGSTLEDLGYDSNYSLKPKNKIATVPNLDKLVSIVDKGTIEVVSPTLFDFGAAGKGYFVDILVRFLKKRKIKRFLVSGSGDIYYHGTEPIKVGLEHSGDPSKVIGAIEIKTGAMCASATNRRRWGNYHHIIDPETLKPASEIIATWVIADKAVIADALATALFLVAPDNFSTKYKFEYLILNKDYKVKKSPGFNAELF